MIDSNTMKNLQSLSKLRLESEEEHNLATQLEQILQYFEVLAGYETVDTDLDAALESRDLRPDESAQSFSRETLESVAVSMHDGHFIVPRILEKSDG
jgi:aspartyl/glutamyl-tRNA(Asn/Gln) amidotransferase C subunit